MGYVSRDISHQWTFPLFQNHHFDRPLHIAKRQKENFFQNSPKTDRMLRERKSENRKIPQNLGRPK